MVHARCRANTAHDTVFVAKEDRVLDSRVQERDVGHTFQDFYPVQQGDAAVVADCAGLALAMALVGCELSDIDCGIIKDRLPHLLILKLRDC